MTFDIQKTSYHKNPFIGLFMRANERHAILPPTAPEKIKEQARAALGVELIETFLEQSTLCGLFCQFNSHGAILAAETREDEAMVLEKAGYAVHVMTSGLAPGNVLLCNDAACIASPKVSQKEAEAIGEALKVPVTRQVFSGMPTIGATSLVTNTGLFAYNEVTEVEFKHMQKILGVLGINGTANGGTPFNALSVVANTRGALLGDLTTGVETQRIFEALNGG